MIYNSFLYITLFPFLFLLLHAIKKEAIKKYFLLAISYAQIGRASCRERV